MEIQSIIAQKQQRFDANFNFHSLVEGGKWLAVMIKYLQFVLNELKHAQS